MLQSDRSVATNEWGQISGTLGRPHLHIEFPGDVSSKSYPCPQDALAVAAVSRAVRLIAGGANQWSGASPRDQASGLGSSTFFYPPVAALAILVVCSPHRVSLLGFSSLPDLRYAYTEDCVRSSYPFPPQNQDELESTVNGQPAGSALVPGHGVQGPHPAAIRLVRAAAAFTSRKDHRASESPLLPVAH